MAGRVRCLGGLRGMHPPSSSYSLVSEFPEHRSYSRAPRGLTLTLATTTAVALVVVPLAIAAVNTGTGVVTVPAAVAVTSTEAKAILGTYVGNTADGEALPASPGWTTWM